MKLDFHVHGILTKKSKFDEEMFLQGIEYAKEQGLNGIIMCEHFNAMNIFDIYNYLNENYPYEGDRYNVNGFYIFLGMEVDIKEGGHIIVSGNRKDILEIRNYLEGYTKKPDFIPFEDLLDIGEKYGCLMVGSHPYRDEHNISKHPHRLLARLDALDLNATDIFKKGISITVNEVALLSKELGIPYVTGSDSHFPIQLGSVSTRFEKDILNIKDLKYEIKSKNYDVEISNSIKLKVFAAKKAKESIKRTLNT